MTQDQASQVGEVADLRWDLTAQIVAAQMQRIQVGEVAQLWWDLTTQLVVTQVQETQICEVAYLRWDLTDEAGDGKHYPGDSAASSTVMPCQSSRGASVSQLVLPGPRVAARGLIQRDERGPVRARVSRGVRT